MSQCPAGGGIVLPAGDHLTQPRCDAPRKTEALVLPPLHSMEPESAPPSNGNRSAHTNCAPSAVVPHKPEGMVVKVVDGRPILRRPQTPGNGAQRRVSDSIEEPPSSDEAPAAVECSPTAAITATARYEEGQDELLPPQTECGDSEAGSANTVPPLLTCPAAAVSGSPPTAAPTTQEQASDGCSPRHPCHDMDEMNDGRVPLPYEIDAETFDVPRTCPDDHMAGDNRYWRPGKPLRVMYVSWNLANNEPRMGEVASFCVHPNAHIIVVGTQENGPYVSTNGKQRQWARSVGHDCLHDQYTSVGDKQMWAMHIAVFARTRDVADYVSHVEHAGVATGLMGGVGGNKGGVAVALAISMVPRPISDPTAHRTGVDEMVDSYIGDGGFSELTPVLTGTESRASVPRLPVASNRTAERSPRAERSDAGNPLHGPNGGGNLTTAQVLSLHAEESFDGTLRHDADRAGERRWRGQSEKLGRKERNARRRADNAAPPPNFLTILCITSHLAAHHGAVHKRNGDYRNIVRQLRVGYRGTYRRFFRRLLGEKQCTRGEGGLSGTSSETDAMAQALSPLGGPLSPPVGRQSSRFTEASSVDIAEAAAAAGDDEVDIATLELPNVPASRGRERNRRDHRDVTEEYDVTLFGGDLNYRIDGTRKAIEHIVHHRKSIRSILIHNDQLTLERARGTVFQGFQEGALLFRPTYKYEVSAADSVTLDEYNFSSKKNRMPAYCDRVLYKKRRASTAEKVAIRLYTDVPNVRTSDHRPVVAIFDIATVAYLGDAGEEIE